MTVMKIELTIDHLMRILEQERALYQTMLTVIEEEGQAAVESKLDSLIDAGRAKENILDKIQPLESERREVVARVAKTLGCSDREVTLARISRHLDETLAGRLNRTGSDLSTVLNTVNTANQKNKRLFEHSLELLKGSISYLSDLTCSQTVYYRTGYIQKAYQAGRCVNGEI